MSETNWSPISAELVAAKLEQIANFQQPELHEELTEQPRFAEVLWFLQFVSHPDNYPGGLAKFCLDFLSDCADALGTSNMTAWDGAKRLTFEQAGRIYNEMPESSQYSLTRAGDAGELLRAAFPAAEDYLSMAALLDRPAAPREKVKLSASEKAKIVELFTPETLRAICLDAAKGHLPTYFKRLCEEPNVSFCRRGARDWLNNSPRAPWYFVNVADALLSFIDRRKAKLASRIADTEITKLVFEWMGVAHATESGVLIEGNSRFGKTEAIKLWTDMNPGIARLVNTPATNAIADLLREVARALGIDSAPGRRGHDLRDRIEYVLRFSKLLLCFDESNFLLPGSYSKNTAPARLNWVRRAIMDRGTPTVFVHTPQNNAPAKKRFVKATGYEMAQFDERVFTVVLPTELSEDDLLAVAKVHFRELSELHLKYVVSKALATERNYVSDIGKIATLANYKAKANGRALPLLADINAAIANVLPTAKATAPAQPVAVPGALIARPAQTRQKRVAVDRPRKPCTRVAEPLQASRITFSDSAQRAGNEVETAAL